MNDVVRCQVGSDGYLGKISQFVQLKLCGGKKKYDQKTLLLLTTFEILTMDASLYMDFGEQGQDGAPPSDPPRGTGEVARFTYELNGLNTIWSS